MYPSSNVTESWPEAAPAAAPHLGSAGTHPSQDWRRRLVYDHVGPQGLEGRLRIVEERSSPAFAEGLAMLGRPHTVLLGMSLGNGFFSRKRIEIAVAGFAHLSGDLATLVPDTIALHTYRALGYDEAEAHAHVRRHGNSLKKRCRVAIERSCAITPNARVRMIDWDRDAATLPGVPAAYARIEGLFETHAGFRQEALGVASSVLLAKRPEAPADNAVCEAVRYLLHELAFISCCRTLFGGEVLIPYHKPFSLGARFCEGAFGPPVPGVGWAVYDVELHGEGGQDGN